MPSAGSYNTVRTAKIISPLPAWSKRVLALLDNITDCGIVVGSYKRLNGKYQIELDAGK